VRIRKTPEASFSSHMQFIPEEVSNVLTQKPVQFKVHALLHQAWSNGKYMAQIFLR
jgi:hypothetical protein